MDESAVGHLLRDAQLDLFEHRDTEFLQRCRTLAVEVARKQGSVCINDVRAQVSLPYNVHPSVLGAVFRDRKQFIPCGFTEAAHREAHARVVRVYRLAGEGA
jgi:hypothetical protein